MRALPIGLVVSLLGLQLGSGVGCAGDNTHPDITSAAASDTTTGSHGHTSTDGDTGGVGTTDSGSTGGDASSDSSTDSTTGTSSSTSSSTSTSTTGGTSSHSTGTSGSHSSSTSTGTTGTSASLRVAEWNIEFFGKPDAGPSDDGLQTSNVAAAVGPIAPDIMGFEEVCDTTDFATVMSTLHSQFGLDYTAIVANDPSLNNAYANYGGTWGQKTALIFKTSVATRVSAQLVYRSDIDSDWGTTFASRTPLEVQLQLAGSGTHLYVLVLHLKSGADSASYDQRVKESQDVKAYLDLVHPNDDVMVIGDWNDDLTGSIIRGDASPFANFVSDSAHYEFATMPFSTAGTSTTDDHSGHPIDHHLINSHLFGNLRVGSAQIVKPNITNYQDTTSDHYPTVVDYNRP